MRKVKQKINHWRRQYKMLRYNVACLPTIDYLNFINGPLPEEFFEMRTNNVYTDVDSITPEQKEKLITAADELTGGRFSALMGQRKELWGRGQDDLVLAQGIINKCRPNVDHGRDFLPLMVPGHHIKQSI